MSSHASSLTLPALDLSLLANVQHVALDMDGTIYSGGTLFPFTKPFLALMDELGIHYTFLTNNSSKSTSAYLAHLQKKDIKARPEQLYTSTIATIEHLRERYPRVKRLFVLGTVSMREEMAAAGFELTSDSAADVPDAVIVAFDTELNYARLCRATYWVGQHKLYIATHPDRVCPTDQPTILVDCGAVCACIESAAGRLPDVTLGKPDPCMIRGILQRYGLRPHELAMVGDRGYTDMEMARRAGAVGVLVLTGETTLTAARKLPHQPDYILPSLTELGEALTQARRQARPRKSNSQSQIENSRVQIP